MSDQILDWVPLPLTPPHPPCPPPPTRWSLPIRSPRRGADIVAVGADLQPGTILAAYSQSLFPMPIDSGTALGWYSPNPRGILPLGNLRVTRSLRRSMRRYTARLDTQFRTVMEQCAQPRGTGDWITAELIDAYTQLHELGWAHSIEVYEPDTDELVGGLYGVAINGFFAGESMFHRATDASKVALVHLVTWLKARQATLLDVQWTTDHLKSLGAVDITRHEYLPLLQQALATKVRR